MIKQFKRSFSITLFSVFISLILFSSQLVWAKASYGPGDWVILMSSKSLGIPLHSEAKSSLFDRVKNGTRAKILDTAKKNTWFNVLLEDGRKGWITNRYIQKRIQTPQDVTEALKKQAAAIRPVSDPVKRIWSSEKGCKSITYGKKELLAKEKNVIRLGTWNIRWFPDGSMKPRSKKNTNLNWLACTITWMNLDILAVQEFRLTPKARKALDNLIRQLNTNTGGNWAYDIQPCGKNKYKQHSGFIWNKKRLLLSSPAYLWEFNPYATAQREMCKNNLRPGRYAYIKSNKPGGVDFHIITVHQDSGPDKQSMQRREKVLHRIDQAVAPFLGKDSDIIILGDFNTMGTSRMTDREEIERMYDIVSAETPGFRHLDIDAGCTEYFDDRTIGAMHAGWLDHILVSKTMSEIKDTTARVFGYCILKNCENFKGRKPEGYLNLSDHCPIVFDIKDVDDDNN